MRRNHARKELVRLMASLEARESVESVFEGLTTGEMMKFTLRSLGGDLRNVLVFLRRRSRMAAGKVRRLFSQP